MRYLLIRVYTDKITGRIKTEEIECKTLKEATALGSILTDEEKYLGSYIFDNVNHEHLTLKGK